LSAILEHKSATKRAKNQQQFEAMNHHQIKHDIQPRIKANY
tara:strand:+ start:647 stop:769 length:123 start_codon:yes stop_codon:yes gene_type:complete